MYHLLAYEKPFITVLFEGPSYKVKVHLMTIEIIAKYLSNTSVKQNSKRRG